MAQDCKESISETHLRRLQIALFGMCEIIQMAARFRKDENSQPAVTTPSARSWAQQRGPGHEIKIELEIKIEIAISGGGEHVI